MKSKLFLFLFTACIAAGQVSAQKDKHFEIGLQGGYGSVWIINQSNYGLPEMDYEYTWGGGYNFQAGYNFTENIGVFTEVGILNQGQHYNDTWDNNRDMKREVSLKYLNVPVFFKYSYGESRARFRLLVGPQFGFLQKAEQVYQVDGADFHQDIEDKEGNIFDAGAPDITDRYNSTDISFVLDLGADIFLMENVLYASIGVRMFYGLTDINIDAYQLKNLEGNYQASHNAGGTFMFGLHYIIAGKK
ncbi:MAG: porin family protein [Bacteroidales bacterium]|jgi:hypothetical protein|nr:porin family protein [Bacteroidales bacterium]